MSAEDWYQEISNNMTSEELEDIRKYYDGWSGQDYPDINHRFVKIVARKSNDPKIRWYHLHQLVNKRRISNEMLPDQIRVITSKGIYPLRIFHSCTEWLAPNEVSMNPTARIINSGFIPVENDDNLSHSLQTAQYISKMVDNVDFVFSGNKSIHSWVWHTPANLGDKEIANAKLRERAEVRYRQKYFRFIQKSCPFTLDDRISVDPRRVVPIIGTLNALTNRVVVKISRNQINKITEGDILKNSAEIKF